MAYGYKIQGYAHDMHKDNFILLLQPAAFSAV
jgi:hypothetical protein